MIQYYFIFLIESNRATMKLSSIILLANLSMLALASTNIVEADYFRKETLPANDTRLLPFTQPIADFLFCNRIWQASSTDPLSSLVGWYVLYTRLLFSA
jgi:hypothetical protein